MLCGIQDPQELAKHRDHRCRKSTSEIAKSLEGDYRNEHIFTLRQAVELYDSYTENLPKTLETAIDFECFSVECK